MHFSGLIFLFLCGESHDRDGAERNRGALRNCGWKELEEGTNTNVQNLKGKWDCFLQGVQAVLGEDILKFLFLKIIDTTSFAYPLTDRAVLH